MCEPENTENRKPENTTTGFSPIIRAGDFRACAYANEKRPQLKEDLEDHTQILHVLAKQEREIKRLETELAKVMEDNWKYRQLLIRTYKLYRDNNNLRGDLERIFGPVNLVQPITPIQPDEVDNKLRKDYP